MAATLATVDPDRLQAALARLTPGSVAYRLVAEALAWEDQSADERGAELALERHLEDRGYEEARGQEAWEASQGIF